MKDFFIKQLVNLKRSPHIIPLILVVISCMVYTFNLTELSNTAVRISTEIAALYIFIVTLLSILSIFSFLNAFSKGKCRPFMLVIEFVLIGIQLFLDVQCHNIFVKEQYILIAEGLEPNIDIAQATTTTNNHIMMLCIVIGSIVLLPVYSWLLRKIKTNIVDNEMVELDDSQLDLADEEDEFVD